MKFDITKQTDKKESFRVEKVIGMFELQPENLTQHFTGEIVLPNEWNVGVIVGRSGTGKSTIAKELYEPYKTTYTEKPIIDEMPTDKTVESITRVFTNVGFSSPPGWLKPYSVLSNGEKMRVDLAKALLEDKDTIVFDEFTSVVDRDVAKVVSFVVQKNIRKENKKFIAVTCHYDVVDWLDPDWVFNTDQMQMVERKKKDQISQSIYTRGQQISGPSLASITI